MRTLRNTTWMLTGIGLMVGLVGCSGGEDPNKLGNDNSLAGGDPFVPGPGGVPGGGGGGVGGQPAEEGPPVQLEQRKRDYGESLRTASLKLVGEIPTLTEINSIANAPGEAEQKRVYEAHVDRLIADPRFVGKMVDFWRDTLRTAQVGAVATQGNAAGLNRDFAANFAALVTVQNRPYTDLFTAASGTCPTFDPATNTLTVADCAANGPVAGLITDRGLMAQYAAPMAFRRVRFIQETFVCAKYPTEFNAKPTSMGATVYTNTWPFDSITGGSGAKIDFKDTGSVNCANCHGTINHQAPLFANYNDFGVYDATRIGVQVPVAGNPVAKLEDWLPAGKQTFAWRFGKDVADLPGFGAEMAKDQDVAACAVTRAWNFAFSRGDVVGDLATVPAVVTKSEVAAFKAGGMKFKDTIARIFKSDDFTMW